MGATDGELALKFFAPIRLGRGENNREVRGQRIGRIQRERGAVRAGWIQAAGRLDCASAHRVAVVLGMPVTVTFTRVTPARGKKLDLVNLWGSLKAAQDEVAAILGVDDADPRVKWSEPMQERGDWGLWVHIVARLPGPVVVAPKASMSAISKKHSRPVPAFPKEFLRSPDPDPCPPRVAPNNELARWLRKHDARRPRSPKADLNLKPAFTPGRNA